MTRKIVMLALTGIVIACGGGTSGTSSAAGGAAASEAATSSRSSEFGPIPSILVDPPAPQAQ